MVASLAEAKYRTVIECEDIMCVRVGVCVLVLFYEVLLPFAIHHY